MCCVLHILVIVATAIGFAVLAVVGGYGWVKWRQFQTAATSSSCRHNRCGSGGVPDGHQAAD